MLLEQLVEKAKEPPRYDWESYYRWLYSAIAGREVSDIRFWLCEKCLSVNILFLPAKYGKCRSCELIYMT